MTDAPLHSEVEAHIQFLCSMHGGPTVGWAMAKDLQAIALLAAEKAREEQREVDAKIAKSATLPGHFHWGEDAMESFDFGKECAAEAIRRGTP